MGNYVFLLLPIRHICVHPSHRRVPGTSAFTIGGMSAFTNGGVNAVTIEGISAVNIGGISAFNKVGGMSGGTG